MLLNESDNFNVIDELFKLRELYLERVTKEDEEAIINEYGLNKVSYGDLSDLINLLCKNSNKDADKLIETLDNFLEIKDLLARNDCEKYYRAGIEDAVNIILNNKFSSIDKNS